MMMPRTINYAAYGEILIRQLRDVLLGRIAYHLPDSKVSVSFQSESSPVCSEETWNNLILCADVDGKFSISVPSSLLIGRSGRYADISKVPHQPALVAQARQQKYLLDIEDTSTAAAIRYIDFKVEPNGAITASVLLENSNKAWGWEELRDSGRALIADLDTTESGLECIIKLAGLDNGLTTDNIELCVNRNTLKLEYTSIAYKDASGYTIALHTKSADPQLLDWFIKGVLKSKAYSRLGSKVKAESVEFDDEDGNPTNVTYDGVAVGVAVNCLPSDYTRQFPSKEVGFIIRVSREFNVHALQSDAVFEEAQE